MAAYQCRSISKAAESMFISQQAVSHNIRKLEKALGGPLFERMSSGITATPLGEALIGDAKALLADSQSIEEKAAALTRNVSGLTIAYADGVFSVDDAADIGALTAYAQDELQTPLTLLELTTSKCLSMLRSGEADLLCIFNPAPDSALRIETLCAYPMYVGMAPDHPLAGKEVITGDDLAPYALIIDQRDDALNAMMSASSPDSPRARRYAPSTQLSSFAGILRRDHSLLIFTLPFVRTYAGEDAVIRPYAVRRDALRLCAVYRKGHPQSGRLAKITRWLQAQYQP